MEATGGILEATVLEATGVIVLEATGVIVLVMATEGSGSIITDPTINLIEITIRGLTAGIITVATGIRGITITGATIGDITTAII